MVTIKRAKQLQMQKNKMKVPEELTLLVSLRSLLVWILVQIYERFYYTLGITHAFIKTTEQERMHFKTEINGNHAIVKHLRY